MTIRPPRLLPALLCALAVASTSAQTVQRAIITKEASFLQTSTADPILEPRNPGPGYGGPFSFHISISGLNLSGITPPTVTLAPGSLYPTQNPFRHNGGVLGYDPLDQEWGYGIDANNYGAATAAARDLSLAYGIYGLNILGEFFTLNLINTAFPPNTPKFAVTGGTWSGGKYVVDVTQPLTLTTNAFTNFQQNADGVLDLWLGDLGPDQLVFRSDNPAAPNFLTVTIPANTLTAGTDYEAEATFFAVTDKRGTLATRLDAAALALKTRFVIAAVPPAAPGALGKLHGIGEIIGGQEFSEVRDAVKVGGVIYAVGDSNAHGLATGADTAIVWTTTDGIRSLPDITTNFSGTNFGNVAAIQITPDGKYIASRARATANAQSRHAVRVTTSTMTNLDLGTLPGFTNSQAHGISHDGSILYGIANYTNLASVPMRTRAVRYVAGSTAPTVIPFLLPGDDSSAPADRAVSAGGSVTVGRSTNGTVDASAASPGGTGLGLGNRAFRYVHGGGVSAIPLPAGGTWSGAIALSTNGNLSLVRGDSTPAPQGEFYLHNGTTGALTSFGTPNGSRRPGGIVSMSEDGSVFVAPFIAAQNPIPLPYIRNAHGYHDMHTLIERAGVDLAGWSLRENVFGMSPDGTLIWGRGVHNGRLEGFVVELAPGYLASYQEPAVYSTPDASIVGAWSFDDFPSTGLGAGVVTFFSNGYYILTETALPQDAPTGISGFERGQYTWDRATGAITFHTLVDTGGDYGFSGLNNLSGVTLTVTGDSALFTSPGEAPLTLTRIVSAASPLIGAWGEAAVHDQSTAVVFLPNGYYFLARDGDAGDPNGRDGIEWGTYTWDAATGAFTAAPMVDTNGQWGFSHPTAQQTIALSPNLRTLIGNAGAYSLPRVGTAPATVALSNLQQTYNGAPRPVTVTTSPAGIATAVTYSGSPIVPRDAGTYAVTATLADPNYRGSAATGTLTILKAAPTITISGTEQVYDGTPKPVTVVTNPGGLVTTVTYNGAAAAPVNFGTYPMVVTAVGPNHEGQANATLVIGTGTTIAELIAVVRALPNLTPAEKTALIAKLEAAEKSFANGNANATRGQLEAFVNQVEALVRSNRLDAATGQILSTAANRIVAALPTGRG